MAHADTTQRLRLITGLRALADFLEDRPEIPAPRSVEVSAFAADGTDDAMRAEIDRVIALLGSEIERQHLDHGHYSTSLDFGPVRYAAIAVLADARARFDALNSYRGAVTPDAPEGL